MASSVLSVHPSIQIHGFSMKIIGIFGLEAVYHFCSSLFGKYVEMVVRGA